jgi:integrase/recombinase XerD
MDNFKEYQFFLDAKSDKSPLTIKSYSIACEKFFGALGIDSIDKLKDLKANEIRSYIMGLNVSANTKNGQIRVLKLLFSWMYKNDFISENPMLKIDKQKVGKKVLRVPTEEEMEMVISNCENKTTHLMIGLGSRVGLRREEICLIKISDISQDGKIKVNGKGNKEAVLKLPEQLFDEIKKYIAHKNRRESEYLFSYDGHKVSTTSINKRFVEYVETLDLTDERKKVLRRVHSYRHFCGTRVYNITHDPYAVRHQLRHADISIGQIYIHPKADEYDNLSSSL